MRFKLVASAERVLGIIAGAKRFRCARVLFQPSFTSNDHFSSLTQISDVLVFLFRGVLSPWFMTDAEHDLNCPDTFHSAALKK